MKSFLAAHGGIAGSVHRVQGELLRLSSSVNIPPPVVKVTESIPKGKGMAGLAWERDAIVSTCNLQEDKTGDVRPGAKAVSAQAALAIPVRTASGSLRAVVGIAWLGERTFSETELAAFEESASSLPESD